MEMIEIENTNYSKTKSYENLAKYKVYDMDEKKPLKTYIKEGSETSDNGVYTDYEMTQAQASLTFINHNYLYPVKICKL